ncbi:MAG: endonuclease/exonuclease/phosphatase family protein [Actinomycetota bacterium]
MVLTWPALVAVVGALLLRYQGADRPLTVALVGLTPTLVLPLTLAALGTWWSRSTATRAATAAVAAVFLVTMNPVSAVVGCRGHAPADAITVYSANVLFDTGRPADIAASAVASGADVIVLQEVTWNTLQELKAQPALDDYAYRSNAGERGPVSGKIIWSRWPLSDVTVEPFVASRSLSATVESPQGSFRLTNVHTAAPSSRTTVWPWQVQFEQLRQVPTTEPAVLAGDFNATGDHRPFRQLLDQGWTDVHEPKGCGFDATWPARGPIPTPFYRLDHVLVTDHFEVLDVRLGDPAGSDHIPVITELQLGEARLGSRAVDPTSS